MPAQTAMPDNNPFNAAKAEVQQILSAPDPQAAFNQMIASNPTLKNAWELMLKYGNGDPHAAYINRAAEMGNQAFASQILQGLGLG